MTVQRRFWKGSIFCTKFEIDLFKQRASYHFKASEFRNIANASNSSFSITDEIIY